MLIETINQLELDTVTRHLIISILVIVSRRDSFLDTFTYSTQHS